MGVVRPVRLFLLALGLALLASPIGAGSLQAVGGGLELVLTRIGDELEIVSPATGSTVRSLAPGVSIHAFGVLDSGWLAVGTRRIDGRTDLFLLRSAGGLVGELPAPAGGTGWLRGGPRPFIESGHLVGLAWLEGADRRTLAVRAADWNGAEFGPPAVVSAAGPGSQLALTSTVLSDGSWLLAWSAFDGKDDEILWSRRRGASWSRPRRVAADNAVPDVTPRFVRADNETFLAWSRFDGSDYRIVLAHLDGDRWSAPRQVGPRGSFAPSVLPSSSTALLLFQTAAPPGWEALEVDAQGTIRRRVTLPMPLADRPVLTAGPASVRFAWPSLGIERTVTWEPVP